MLFEGAGLGLRDCREYIGALLGSRLASRSAGLTLGNS